MYLMKKAHTCTTVPSCVRRFGLMLFDVYIYCVQCLNKKSVNTQENGIQNVSWIMSPKALALAALCRFYMNMSV